MHWRTRQAALRAVAKLTWGGGATVAALACSGATATTHADGSGGAAAVAGQPSTDTGGTKSDVSPTMPDSGGAASTTSGTAASSGAATMSAGGGSSTAGEGAGPAELGGAGGQAPDGAGGATAECTASIAFDPDNVVRASVPEEELACCAAEVLTRLDQEDAKTDPSIVNCCTAIVLGSNTSSPHYGSEVRSYCCAGGVVAEPEALYALPFCTPWGPPVPPSMPGAMA